MIPRILETRHGAVAFPTFMPVTTFGGRYPLDELVRPYLGRFAQCVMVSYHYAQQMNTQMRLPLFVDSGGFASLFEGSAVVQGRDYDGIATKEGDLISPPDVLVFQEKHADLGATLDFIVPPDCDTETAIVRQQATIKNAIWAISNRTRVDFHLFASIQAWDEESAIRIMQALAPYPFSGFALGGMVPRIKDPEIILSIVRAMRAVDDQRPLHVFGVGNPELIRQLFVAGVDSTDSSSYVRSSADGKYLDPVDGKWRDLANENDHQPRCKCPACSCGMDYLAMEGEANRMALVLHNLTTLFQLIETISVTDAVRQTKTRPILHEVEPGIRSYQ